jgi:hypothetical protein
MWVSRLGWPPFILTGQPKQRTCMVGLYIVLAVCIFLAIYFNKKYEDERWDNKRLKDYLMSKGVNPDKDIPFPIYRRDVLKELFNKDR